MRKLKLKALELGAREVLKRAQLKNVFGGSGSCSGSGDVFTKSCTDGKGKHFGCYTDPVNHIACRCPTSGYACS